MNIMKISLFFSVDPEVRKRSKVWRALHVCRSLIGHIPDEPYIPDATLPLSPGKKRYFVNVFAYKGSAGFYRYRRFGAVFTIFILHCI